MIADFTSKAGKVKSITYESEALESGEVYTLKVIYKIECEKGKPTGTIKFKFDGLKGHLLAFNLE